MSPPVATSEGITCDVFVLKFISGKVNLADISTKAQAVAVFN